MMNLRGRPHHKICGMPLDRLEAASAPQNASLQSSEAGYTLVALLAVMTLLALFAMAAAPNIRQQAQREREKEAIFRGEQVADAIRAYYVAKANSGVGVGEQSLPTSIDQLREGIPIPGGAKKLQVLRASAARDPLSTDGEWRLVAPRTQALMDFQRSLIAYAGNVLPPPSDPQLSQLQQFAAPLLTNVLNSGSLGTAPGGEDTSANSTGPFVGVASRSKNNSVLYYYGIDRHDQWVFTPLFR
ncbi:MAG: hypothetical protein ABJB97_00515 [Acidobacteriota bacterium]